MKTFSEVVKMYGNQSTKLDVAISQTGEWKLDRVLGKSILTLTISHKNNGNSLKYSPTHDEVDMIMDKMLQAELENDCFVFPEPCKNGKQRVTQIYSKIERCRRVLDKWEKIAIERLGYKKPHLF